MAKLLLLLCLIICGSAFAQNARVQAELSSQVVAMGGSVNMQVIASGLDAELDVTALEADFEVISRGSSRQISVLNGARESTVIWNLQLRPLRVGQLVVPSVKVGQLTTSPLLLQVTNAPSGAERVLFVEASVDNAEPYVQSQIIYTIKVYQRVQLLDGSLDYPNVPGITAQQFGGDEQSTEIVDGQTFSVLQRRYVLFPQNSGPVVIPPVNLRGYLPGQRSRSTGLFTPRNPLTRQSEAIELEVKPRPANFTGQWWLPVTALELDANWVTPAEDFSVGQPLTRIVTLTATGVGESQLPEISPPELAQAKTYADASEANTVSIDSGVQSQRQYSWAIIPQRAGNLTLPAITLPWFNVATGEIQTATVPEQTIDIKPAAGAELSANSTSTTSSANSTVPEEVGDSTTNNLAVVDSLAASSDAQFSDNKGTQFWKRLALIFGGVWLLTVAAWATQAMRSKQSREPEDLREQSASPRIPIQIAAVEAAIKNNDMPSLSRSISAWGRAMYGTASASPGELAGRVESDELKRQFRGLDQALYSPNGTADIASFSQLPQLLRAEKPNISVAGGVSSQNQHALPPL